MSPSAQLITHLLALGTIVGQVGVLVGIAGLLLSRSRIGVAMVKLMGRFAIPLGLLVTIAGTVASLYYSDVVGFAPCLLCWIQRVLLYPQVVLLGILLFRKSSVAWVMCVAFSALGLVVALYNHYLQLGGSALVPCPSNGASCATRYIWEFGYITMPLMSATAFAILLVLLVAERRSRLTATSKPS